MPAEDRPPTARQPLPTATAIVVGVLLAVPVLALLIVPIYARRGPELFGFPFFYWYQLLWVFFAAGFTLAAYTLVQRARRGDRG